MAWLKNAEMERIAATLYGARHRTATAGVMALILVVGYHVLFGANGAVVYQKKRAEYQELQKQVQSLQQENERLADRVHRLKTDPAAIEREAREQLHYARPGEVVYTTSGQPQPVKPPGKGR